MEKKAHHTPGRVIWITGLSGAGKSTLATALVQRMNTRGETAVLLDGDELREVFGAASTPHGHDRSARLALAMQYAHLCRVIASQGFTVVIATISLFKEVHSWNRAHLPGYFEVYLKVPVEELRRRDPKDIYRRFDEGNLKNVAGLDLPIDEPDNADCLIEHAPDQSVPALADQLLSLLEDRKSL
ncbi:MAG: adenylyl-sulfate kinase [Actinomycetota bacterium]